jgi:hypothetical protein
MRICGDSRVSGDGCFVRVTLLATAENVGKLMQNLGRGCRICIAAGSAVSASM